MDEDTVIPASDDGWGEDVDLSDVDLGDEDEGEPEPTAEADQPTPEEAKTEEPAKQEVPPEKPAEADQLTLKYLGQEKTVTREEAVTLAQKGMDYDRIRTERDTLKAASEESAKNGEAVKFLQDLAQKQGYTVPELIDSIRAKEIAEREQIDVSVALGRVKNQRTERELLSEKEKLTQSKTKETDEQAAAQKRRQDVDDFISAYPDKRDLKGLPEEVWDAVRAGEKLVHAYNRYEVKRLGDELKKLNGQLETERQNVKNKTRATGSQSTTGKAKYEDEIDKYWKD